MTLPSVRLPSYVNLDVTSPWEVSGLLSSAMESMALPSRLKPQNGLRQTLDQLSSTLNVNGNQNIAKLRMTVKQKSETVASDNVHTRMNEHSHATDTRISSAWTLSHGEDMAEESGTANFDIDFFPTETGEQNRGRQKHGKVHVFGQVENYRGDEEYDEENDRNDEGRERARRIAASLPLLSKLVVTIKVSLQFAYFIPTGHTLRYLSHFLIAFLVFSLEKLIISPIYQLAHLFPPTHLLL